MPDLVHPLGRRHLVARVSDRLAPLGQRALAELASVLDDDAEDGAEVSLLWWPLELRAEADGLRLLAPEALGGGREDLSSVVGLLAMQLDAAQRLGVEPPGFDPDETVEVAPGTLTSAKVMLQRLPDAPRGTTGWHLRPDGPLRGYDDDYQRVPVAELARTRTGLLVPLSLPSGLLVRVHGDVITSVLDEERRERWAR